MKKVIAVSFCLLWCVCLSCSLPPERPIKKEELYKTGAYNNYTIKESPERVLAALNKSGEVVLEAVFKAQPVYLKIMATSSGLHLFVSER